MYPCVPQMVWMKPTTANKPDEQNTRLGGQTRAPGARDPAITVHEHPASAFVPGVRARRPGAGFVRRSLWQALARALAADHVGGQSCARPRAGGHGSVRSPRRIDWRSCCACGSTLLVGTWRLGPSNGATLMTSVLHLDICPLDRGHQPRRFHPIWCSLVPDPGLISSISSWRLQAKEGSPHCPGTRR